jgi:hypothetical protein
MPSAATLVTMTADVRQVLENTAGGIFTTVALEDSIAYAINEYSQIRPLGTTSTLAISAASRELSLTTLTGLLGISRVWFPYTAAAPEYPPPWIEFDVWWSAGVPTLYLKTDDLPQIGQVARIFWLKVHTLNGLDAATGTTFDPNMDAILASLAAGHAAYSHVATLVVTHLIDPSQATRLYGWGVTLINDFRAKFGLPALKTPGFSVMM